MRNRCHLIAMLSAGMLAAGASPVLATDGHLLHGVGAINSAMGGAAVASATSILGAFYVNPAGLAQFKASRTELGFEMFKPARTLRSNFGSASGSTASSSEFTPIPAFAWTRAMKDERIVLGVAGIGVGGFGVDYHTDVTNPILAPRPNGFGGVYSAFQLMKIAPAVAMAVTPKVRLGFALNIDWATLAVDPMPIASPAVDPGPDGVPGTADDRAYYSSATDADGSFGIGVQAGVQYVASDLLSLGAAYTSPQVFQKFSYGSVYANPNLPSYNTGRAIQFAMDVPAVYTAGFALTPDKSLLLATDLKYITYANTRGFKASGYNPDGSVKGFGWRNIWAVGTGVQWMATNQVAARLGYNYSGNPVPNDLSMFNIPAPAVVQHHVTMGLGYRALNGFGIDVGYYHAFQNSIDGPFQMMSGAVQGTSVKSSMSEDSMLIGFSFVPAGLR